LDEMVASCRHTILYMDPWDKMVPDMEFGKANALSRVWCVYEVFHTVQSGAKLEVRVERVTAGPPQSRMPLLFRLISVPF